MAAIPTSGDINAERERQLVEQEQRERQQLILDQILEPAARERLERLSLVKKERAKAVQDSLVAAATSGALKNKVSEDQLIKMLENLEGTSGSGTTQKNKITTQRKKYCDDSEDDDDSDLL